MKYIKTFEIKNSDYIGLPYMNTLDSKFKEGNIVLCISNEHVSEYLLKIGNIYLVTKVLGIDLIEIEDVLNKHREVWNNSKFRLATPEEIENFYFQTDINKYNL